MTIWMSRRELRSLAELNLDTSCVQHRLRNRMPWDQPPSLEEDGEAGMSDTQELQEKLQMAQDELEHVPAELTRRLKQAQQTTSNKRTDFAEQLRKLSE